MALGYQEVALPQAGLVGEEWKLYWVQVSTGESGDSDDDYARQLFEAFLGRPTPELLDELDLPGEPEEWSTTTLVSSHQRFAGKVTAIPVFAHLVQKLLVLLLLKEDSEPA